MEKYWRRIKPPSQEPVAAPSPPAADGAPEVTQGVDPGALVDPYQRAL